MANCPTCSFQLRLFRDFDRNKSCYVCPSCKSKLFIPQQAVMTYSGIIGTVVLVVMAFKTSLIATVAWALILAVLSLKYIWHNMRLKILHEGKAEEVVCETCGISIPLSQAKKWGDNFSGVHLFCENCFENYNRYSLRNWFILFGILAVFLLLAFFYTWFIYPRWSPL